MENSELNGRYELAREIALEAGEYVLGHFQRQDLVVDFKRDSTPVTAADRGAEELLRKRILKEFPGDAILGEEHGEADGESGYRWIVDPIDGTKSFIHGVPLFGTLIGIEHKGEIVAGVCQMPALGETVHAARGTGTWWEREGLRPERVRVSKTAILSQALMCYTSVDYYRKQHGVAAFERVTAACGGARAWGDCYGQILVATGRADLIVEPELNAWDIAALVPIIEEAGGEFTDWQGRRRIDSGDGVTTNGLLTGPVLAVLNA